MIKEIEESISNCVFKNARMRIKSIFYLFKKVKEKTRKKRKIETVFFHVPSFIFNIFLV